MWNVVEIKCVVPPEGNIGHGMVVVLISKELGLLLLPWPWREVGSYSIGLRAVT